MANNLLVTEGAGPKATRTVETSSNVHDQAVTQGGATATVTQVSSAATTAQFSAAKTDRRFWSVHNSSTAVLYLKFGTTASSSSYTVKLAADQYYEMPANLYTGRVDGIWASANGFAMVTEVGV